MKTRWLNAKSPKSNIVRAACLVASLSLAWPMVGTADDAKLSIDLGNPSHAIPPTLYGLMTEEINHSYDGGLLAELVQNRTFQDPGKSRDGSPIHWSVVGDAKISTNTVDPVNDALPINLRLELSGGSGGVANDGYWGIPVRPDTRYTAIFYARGNDGFTGPVTVSLVTDSDQTTVVKADSPAITGHWKKYTVTFTTPPGAPTTSKARFVLAATGSGSIDFSFVSLFPPTYQNTPDGLRPDLMKLMAAMHPSFIRLPGGNYLEGGRFSDRFNWKKMIGLPDQRPGHMGCWGYRSSDGFGLPQYLLWCKQLGAEPVLAVFAGYTLNGDHFNAGDPEMALYTQEALQEIEYVMGPATSTWGRRRAQDGFPEPFPLHYVEIGNEDFFDQSGSYDGRFTEIAKAIQAKYPQLKLIATAPVKSFKPDLYDDHMYAGPAAVLGQWHRYDPGSNAPDGREPDGIDVFMGEWATQNGKPTPNMRAALSDAVFAMGLERNSDAVKMECYAPLLANVNPEDKANGYPRGWQWDTNLIGYDALHSFGSPSYYVLATFGQNKGDVVLPATFDVAPVAPQMDANPLGCIGVGVWNTQVEYADITVTAPDGHSLANTDNFAARADSWQFPNIPWTIQDHVIKSNGDSPQGWALVGDRKWDNYTVHLRARKLGGAEGFIILWHAKDGDNYRWWNIGGWGNTTSRCEVSIDGTRQAYGPGSPFQIETGRWYDIRLEVSGHRMRGFIDNKLVIDATDEAPPATVPAYASASYDTKSGDVIVKVVNAGIAPLPTEIDLSGARRIGSHGTAIVLSGDLDAVNSVDHPRNVAPVTEPLTNVSASFTHTFPPHSVTLLRFPAAK